MGTCATISQNNKMDDRSDLLSDIQAPVSAPDDGDDLPPQTTLYSDNEEADQRLQIDSHGAMEGCAYSIPEQGNAEAQPVIPGLENNEPPTDPNAEHPPTTIEALSASDNNRKRVQEGELDGAEYQDGVCFPDDPQPADDVPLLDLSASVKASPLIQILPNSEQSIPDPENNTQAIPVNSTQAEIFSQIYNTTTSNDEDGNDKNKNCCDVVCGKSCHTSFNEGCHMRPLLTESLVRGRDVGWMIFHHIVFPLVSTIHRRIWIASLWLPAVILVFLSLTTIIAASDGKEIPYIFGILLCGIFVVYCVVDTLGTEVCHFQLSSKNAKPYEGDNSGDEQAANGSKKWQKMINLLDFVRLIIPELILFLIVVCDLYLLVVYRSYTGQSAIHLISFVKLLVSCVSLIIHSHVVRLAIIATTAHQLHTQRTPPVDLLEQDHPSNGSPQQPAFDSTLRQAGLRYWKVFIAHSILQLVNQALLIIALGFKLQDYLAWTEALNYDPNLYFNKKATIKVELAFFMIGAYLLPIFGFWLFFVVTYSWLHEFLIGLTVDFVNMLQLPGASEHFFPLDMDNGNEKISKILEYVDFDSLKRDYIEFHMTNTFINKGLYPFRNCMLVLLCMIYSILQILYLSFAMVDIKNRDTATAIIYIIAVVAEVVSSFNAFLVSVFWIVFFFILVLLLWCGFCSKQADTSTRYRYTVNVRPHNSYPIQPQPYFTTRRLTTPPRLNQPVTTARRQPPSSDFHYPSYVASGWTIAGRGQMVVRQNTPRTYTADSSWII